MVDGFVAVGFFCFDFDQAKPCVVLRRNLRCFGMRGSERSAPKSAFQCCTTPPTRVLTHMFVLSLFSDLRRRESLTGRPRVFTPFGVHDSDGYS